MSSTTVAEFATELKKSPDILLEQLRSAGVAKSAPTDALSDADKTLTADSHTAVALLVQQPSIIKRPIVEYPGGILVGFREEEWSVALL